jgi:broad specificity phosphatase PhoE
METSVDRPRPLRLFLVRHGETRSNRELRFLGTGDEPLTPRGHRQAELLAECLTRLPLSEILASPLQRTTETADAIAHRAGLSPVLEPRLREQDYGEWEGLTGAELRERLGEPGLRGWLGDPERTPPGGEPLAAVAARVHDLLSELREGSGQAAEDATREEPDRASEGDPRQVVLVSHVGPIKALLCSALGLPLAGSLRFFLDPGSVSVVDWSDFPMVRLINAQPQPELCPERWARL